MSSKFFIFLLLLISNYLRSQKCSCKINLQNTIKIVESNYAGFKYKVNELNNDQYQKNKNLIIAKTSNKNSDCILLIDQYLSFFKDEHLKIIYNDVTLKNDLSLLNFKNKLTLGSRNVSGVWYHKFKSQKIRIIQNKEYYFGINDNVNDPFFKKGDVIFFFDSSFKSKNVHHGFLYTTSKQLLPSDFYLTPSELSINSQEKYSKNEVKKASNMFQLAKINDSVVYFKLTTFNGYYKAEIDNLIKSNDSLLKQTKYLIIDLRDNTGGSINSFKELMPYLYTQPIPYIGGSYYVSKENLEKYINKFNYQKKLLSKNDSLEEEVFIDSLRANLGAYYFSKIDTLNLPTTLPMPKKIFILANGSSASASEMLIMMSQKSNKVKFLGTATRGAADYLEPLFYTLCDKKYVISVPWIKSYSNLLGYEIDNKGILPDISLEKFLDEHWAKEVIKMIPQIK